MTKSKKRLKKALKHTDNLPNNWFPTETKASAAYFDAKNQVKDALAYRIQAMEEAILLWKAKRSMFNFFWGNSYEEHLAKLNGKLETYKEIHSYVRNYLLFDTEKYK